MIYLDKYSFTKRRTKDIFLVEEIFQIYEQIIIK